MNEFRFKLIDPHQSKFVNSNARYLLNSGGVGSGKTFSLCLKALKLISEHPKIFGLIGAQTYPLLRDTTLREFLNIVPPQIISSYNKTEQHFKFKNGAEVIFRSFDDANKLKSLNLGFCGIEEMTDISEDIFKMLRTRMRQDGMPGCIFGATNPGSFTNFAYKYFIERPIKDSEVVYSISSDNLYLPQVYLDDLESMKASNPEYYARMVMGQWGSLEGVIYNLSIKQRTNEIPLTKKFNRVIAGLDFGFDHPMAFIVIGIIENKYYIIEELYKREMRTGQLIDHIKDRMEKYDISNIYCDHNKPEIIQDLQDAGVPAEKAIKDVFDGIMFVKNIIGLNNLVVSPDCKYALREFDSYIWDAKQTVKEVPLKINDDCMDAIRYAIYTDSRKLGDFKMDDICFGEERMTSEMDF